MELGGKSRHDGITEGSIAILLGTNPVEFGETFNLYNNITHNFSEKRGTQSMEHGALSVE